MLRPILDRLRFRYGSLRGTARSARYKIETWVGRHGSGRGLDWSRVERLVFVCQGNIMRSAYGEVFALREGLPAASFGVKVSERETPALGRRIAAARGLPLDTHRAKPLSAVPLLASDLLLLVDPRHAALLCEVSSRAGCQVSYIGLFAGARNAFLPDPYGKPDAYVHRCFALIEEAVREIRERLDQPPAHR
jgi:protein-tyrosine phosphatase